MWPFNRGGDDGCDAHHFDEYTETDELRTKERLYVWNTSDGEFKGWTFGDKSDLDERGLHGLEAIAIQRKKVKSCQHHGCDEQKTTWPTERVIPLDDLENAGISREEMKEQYAPEDEDE